MMQPLADHAADIAPVRSRGSVTATVGAIVYHLRAEFRRRRASWLAIVVLIGVVGGLVLGAVAGARRTSSAFDRFVQASDAAEVMVNPDDGAFSALDVGELAALPGVRAVGVIEGGGAVLIDDDGAFDNQVQVFAQRGSEAMIAFERPRLVEGRMIDPTAPHEVVLTDDVAERHRVGPGDTITAGTLTMEALEQWEEGGEDGPPPLTVVELDVVGVIVSLDGIVTDEVFQYGQAVLTDAFRLRYEPASYYYGALVDLEGGDDAVPGFQDDVRTLVPDESFEFQTLSAKADAVHRGTRPHVVALLAFAVLLGAAGAVVCAQVVGRELARVRRDAPTLAAMGVSDRSLRASGILLAVAVAVPGALVAVAIGIGASRLFPIGIARRAEVSPGLAVDLAVLVPGAVAIVSLLAGVGAWSLRRAAAATPARPAKSTAGVLDRVARTSNRPVVSTALRAAMRGGAQAAPSSPRGAIAGLAMAVGAVVAALTFGAGLLGLVSSPAHYGWPWDVVVAPPGDDDHVADMAERVRTTPGIVDAVDLIADQLRIDGRRVPAIGIATPASGAGVTVAAGRAPMTPDQIALGGRTMRQLGVDIGDTIEIGEGAERRSLTVVGQAVFPGLGTYSGADRTELGKGALLDREVLADAGEGFFAPFIGLAVADGAVDDVVSGLTAGLDAAVEEGELEVMATPQRPGDIQSLEQVRRTPELIAAVLAVLAGAAVCFVQIAGVRARRRELGLLRTFGFRRRDVLMSVLVQSSATAVVALAVGVPLGIVVGRAAWSSLADSLGVVPESPIPLSIAVVVLVVIALANVVALAPGLLASRVRPASVLRAE